MFKNLVSILFIWLLSSETTIAPVVGSVIPDIEADKKEFVMPEYLNGNTFYDQVSTKLTVVEFFSPYCSHCTSLAPIWKDTVATFEKAGMSKGYNIDFRQVDCVQSGDICSTELVGAYPLIRLYGPEIEGFEKDVETVSKHHLKHYPSDFKRSKEDFIKFAKLESLNYYNTKVTEDDTAEQTSVNEESPLSSDELLSIISDIHVPSGEQMKENDKPWVVVFINENSEINEKKWWLSDSFFKKNWKLLRKELGAYGVNLGTFNCYASVNDKLNTEMCKELIDESLPFPQLVVVTPKKKINKVFPYDVKALGGLSNKKIVDFAVRVNHNSYIPEINTMDLHSFVSSISSEPISLTRGEKIYFVFQYDQETVTTEDYDFLEHLILPLSQIPNFYIYKTHQDLEKFNLRILEKSTNYLKKYGLNTDYSENMFTNKLLTQVPTFHIYKENTMIPNTYRCFSTVDLRDLNMVLKWVYEDSLPTITELKEDNAELIFNYNKENYGQVVLMLLDPLKTDQDLPTTIEDFRKNYEAYELARWNYHYQMLNSKRKMKEDEINKLKDEITGSDKSVLFNEMKKEVLLTDFGNRCLFALLDINKYPLHEYNFVHEFLKGFDRIESLVSGRVLAIRIGKSKKGQIDVLEFLGAYDENGQRLLNGNRFGVSNMLSFFNFAYTLSGDNNDVFSNWRLQTIAPNKYIRVDVESPYQRINFKLIGFIFVAVFFICLCKWKKVNFAKKKNIWNAILKSCLRLLSTLGISVTKTGKFRFAKSTGNKSSLKHKKSGLLPTAYKPIE